MFINFNIFSIAAHLLINTKNGNVHAATFVRSRHINNQYSPNWLSSSTTLVVKQPKYQKNRIFTSNSNDAAGDLTNTLAVLDRKWQIQQQQRSSTGQPRSRWTKLVLVETSNEEDNDANEQVNSLIADTVVPLELQQVDYVYLLEPPNNSIPSCLILFTGGAGLGTYPQIAYNELLLRISDRLNAAVITAPYQVGIDHFSIAKETGDKCRRSIIQCQDDPSRLYPKDIPVYSLSHSLGAKLSAIYVAATDQDFNGIGMMAYNNFGFGQTISMAREFAKTIQASQGRPQQRQEKVTDSYRTGGTTDDIMDGIFNFAEMAVSAIGIDFSPKPMDMERLLSMKFTKERQMKTRLFTFDDDTLENTQQFIDACSVGGTVDTALSVSGLPGTHLTPVYFKLGFDEIFTSTGAAEIPTDAKAMAKEAMGGFESASFGNEDELNVLVDEICSWIKGSGPSRKPSWLRERPKLSGAIE